MANEDSLVGPTFIRVLRKKEASVLTDRLAQVPQSKRRKPTKHENGMDCFDSWASPQGYCSFKLLCFCRKTLWVLGLSSLDLALTLVLARLSSDYSSFLFELIKSLGNGYRDMTASVWNLYRARKMRKLCSSWSWYASKVMIATVTRYPTFSPQMLAHSTSWSVGCCI